jgi:hypothetical protein
MLPAILGPRRRQDDQLPHKIDLTPSQHAHLIPALAKEKQKADNLIVGLSAKATPEHPQFFLC